MTASRTTAYFAVLLVFSLLFFVSWQALHNTLGAYASLNPPKFAWDKITPSDNLVWVRCYAPENFHCARLKVPLDYHDTNPGPDQAFAAIALLRVHSEVPHDSPAYRGPVLINPGGPGGSGVDAVRKAGESFSQIIGPEFDIIGFDPRGIARSTPRASFFRTRADRVLFQSDGLRDTSLNASAEALPRTWARRTLMGKLAAQHDAAEDGFLQFINTEYTARDMMRIVEAHGRDKLQYWGFSYGTLLGATFAAMFPKNVGRLIIDGVVDAESYYAFNSSASIIDTDKAWHTFAAGCVEAGPTGCPFYASTIDEIFSAVDAISLRLRQRPIPVRGTTSFGLVDYSMLRRVMFSSLYAPHAKFHSFAQALSDLRRGSGEALYAMYAAGRPPFDCACDDSDGMNAFEEVEDGGWAVACNDAAPGRSPKGYDAFVRHYEEMRRASSFADIWGQLRSGCVAWPEYQRSQFRGPFNMNTSFPLLVVGNTADPVTPLSAAKNMARSFGNSALLVQDSTGHCSISAPSLCTARHIQAYFKDGKLPAEGTVCKPDFDVFPRTDIATMEGHSQAMLSILPALSVEEKRMVDVLRKLSTDGLVSHVF